MADKQNHPPYRVGIVGAGGIARVHAEVLKNRLGEADLTAICDISQETLSRFGDAFDVPGRYLDLGDMLNKEALDIVIICNWGVDHAKTAIQVAHSKKVKFILCEKPFAMNAEEARQMATAAEENGVLLGEAFKFRHHPMHLKAKELIDDGAIGEVVSVRSTLFSDRQGPGSETIGPDSDWRFCKAKGGGSISDLGCYCLAQARFIYGAEPVRIFAQPQMGIEVDDRAAVLLVFPGCRTAQFTVGFKSSRAHFANIIGTAGSIRMDKPWDNSDKATTLEYQTSGASTTISFEPLLQYTCQLEHVCDCLSTGKPFRISLQHSIDQMKAIDAIAESMATGRVVDL